jgi:hypothetical protein
MAVWEFVSQQAQGLKDAGQEASACKDGANSVAGQPIAVEGSIESELVCLEFLGMCALSCLDASVQNCVTHLVE